MCAPLRRPVQLATAPTAVGVALGRGTRRLRGRAMLGWTPSKPPLLEPHMLSYHAPIVTSACAPASPLSAPPRHLCALLSIRVPTAIQSRFPGATRVWLSCLRPMAARWSISEAFSTPLSTPEGAVPPAASTRFF